MASTKKDATAEPTPETAATVLLLRDAGDGLEVFMIARHREIDTFSGALVFPGGKVDAGDHEPRLRDFCPDAVTWEADNLAIRVAALREAFEECGVLLARARGEDRVIGQDRLDEIRARWQRPIATDQADMLELCDGEGLDLAVDALVPFAHWITPPIVPRIYDTHFFLVRAPEDQVARHDGFEGEDSLWIAPGQAVGDGDAGARVVVFPTRMNLVKLACSGTATEALRQAAATPVVTVRPQVTPHDKGRILSIPAAADYGATRFLVGPGGVGVEVLG